MTSGTAGTAGGFALGTTVTGAVQVLFSDGGLASPLGAAVTLSGSNIKIDLVDGDTIFSNVSATLTGSAKGLT